MMTPERWQKVRDILEQAMELAPEKRFRFLDVACSSDPSLRSEVQSLLSASDDARSSFLESPPLSPAALAPGTKLGDHEIVSQIGSGGMGVVYRARDSRLGRDVAIKVLPSFVSADSDRLRRFEQEARAAAALNHPNILAVFQMGTYQGAPYLVSELLDGETLREVLKRGRLAVRKAIDYGMQIGRGLAAAHEKGIVHRDLKPENLFITKDGRVKILDFGLAKLTLPQSGSDNTAQTLTKGTETGMVMGTVGYMAPEQVRGQTADHRADIFAFGAILYEMLAGKRAFQKTTSAETMTAILNEDPPAISQIATNLAPALQRVVHRCLEKRPEQRFQSASDLAFALDALSETASSAAGYSRKNMSGAGLLGFFRTHKAWALASIVFLGLLLVTGVYFARGRRPSHVAHAEMTHKQFTFTGDAYSPAISPDGLFVAYVSKEPGEPQKLIVQASNGTKAELAQDITLGRPRWSPDGSEILFYKSNPALEKEIQVYVVSRLGGIARPIDKGGSACWIAQDGSQIVTAFAAEWSGFKGFTLVNKLSGEAKLVHLSEYTWLHDIDCSPRAGLILAITETSGIHQIRTFKPDGSDERRLLDSRDAIYSARWSPTGDSIYYLHGKGSTKQLSKLSVTHKDEEPVVLADGLQSGEYFTISADGSRLAYTREAHPSNLWRVALQTADKPAKLEISRLTSGTSYYGAPSFSPDGRWIAFVLGSNEYETNIFKMLVAGGKPVQLTFLEHAMAASPAWSPDGQQIAFIGDQNGTSRVWMISANGGAAQQFGNITGADTGNNRLVWWPSSDIVLQESGVRNYLRINDEAHEEKRIIGSDQSLGWVPFKPVFSPDGKKMAVWWNRKENRGLWLISLEPYSQTFLLSGDIYPVGWSADGKYVYVVRSGSGLKREIVRVQIAAPNEVSSVATLPGDVTESDSASVSPDGHEIVGTVGEAKSEVWLMENFDPAAVQPTK